MKNGEDINVKHHEGHSTLHWFAGGDNSTQIVKDLLDAGANINSKDDEGNTPLWWACRYGYIETIKLLIDRGARSKVLKNLTT